MYEWVYVFVCCHFLCCCYDVADFNTPFSAKMKTKINEKTEIELLHSDYYQKFWICEKQKPKKEEIKIKFD